MTRAKDEQLKRIIAACQEVGLEVVGIEISSGKINLQTKASNQTESVPDTPAYASWKEAHKRRRQV